MAWSLCSSLAAIAKAGVNANSDIVASTATLARWSDEVEGTINGVTRVDWTTDIDAGVATNFKGILQDTSSDMIAKKIIAYDIDGYGVLEGTSMIDILQDNERRNLEILREKGNQEKITTTR